MTEQAGALVDEADGMESRSKPALTEAGFFITLIDKRMQSPMDGVPRWKKA